MTTGNTDKLDVSHTYHLGRPHPIIPPNCFSRRLAWVLQVPVWRTRISAQSGSAHPSHLLGLRPARYPRARNERVLCLLRQARLLGMLDCTQQAAAHP